MTHKPSDMEIMKELEDAINVVQQLYEEVDTLRLRLWYVKYSMEGQSND